MTKLSADSRSSPGPAHEAVVLLNAWNNHPFETAALLRRPSKVHSKDSKLACVVVDILAASRHVGGACAGHS